MTDVERAYLAGLVDGEGCIHVSTEFYLSVMITNTRHDLLVWVASVAGCGGLYRMQRASGNRQCYTWRANGPEAARFLAAVLPFLRIKADRAELALRFQASKDSIPRTACMGRGNAMAEQLRIRNEIMRLNQRGDGTRKVRNGGRPRSKGAVA